MRATSDSTARHLVTTADERTWVFDRPVLFLGEWCRRYARRELWQRMDAVVAVPYGVGLEEKQRDYAYVAELCDRVVPQLAAVLNEQHDTSHSTRYWRIVLGHWLQRCFALLVNRWFSLQQTLNRYDVATTSILDHRGYQLATANSLAFIYASNDDAWNHALYARILARLGIQEQRLDAALAPRERFELTQRPQPSVSGFKAFLRQSMDATLRGLSRDTDAVIINSYLPRAQAAKLQLRMGQVPRVWRFPAAPAAAVDMQLRTQFHERLAGRLSGGNEFETFAYEQAIAMLPLCFLEGYESVRRVLSATSLPHRPGFIYTCSNFDTDEGFKVWAAGKADEGVPYFTGQHGSNYGTMEYCPSERECTATSDSFFTWGWSDGSPKYVPAFMFKLAGQRRPEKLAEDNLLLIQLRIRHRVDTWDNDAEFSRYQENQFQFAEHLPERIRQRLVVRLHAAHEKNFWSDAERWRDRAPAIRLDSGSADLWEMISRSRLVVHSYNSTGVVELLALNIPVMCFWDDAIEVLRDSAAPFYDALERVGILSRTPEVAARRVMEVWDDVDKWWSSSEVQRARLSYCERYGRVVDKPVTLLRQLLSAALTRSGSGALT